LFLALIVGALILAGNAVSFAMRDSLLQTASAAQGEIKPGHAPRSAVPPRREALTALVAPAAGPAQAYQAGTVAVVLALGAWMWYTLYCPAAGRAACRTGRPR
jgi:hypothetical protein